MAGKKHTLWYKDAVVYELHVKAFFDSNNDGVGDFRGLVERLDYIQDLGVSAIWLLPFYPSPLRDDGYDIADYRGVHHQYGTVKDFKAFVREAHRRDLKIITELVVNHTSDQHPWFQAARRAKPDSVRRNFYVWSDTDTKFPETRIIFTDTESSNWAWDPVAGAYYWHRFFSHQPDLNLNDPRVVKAVSRVMRFWLDIGVDGLRLDAVPYLCVREGTNNENLPETHAVVREWRRHLDARYDDRMFLAEANQWPEDVVAYFGQGDECHMAFHFPVMPRIFMALRQEDRHPITEIVNRTPQIPDICQWAIFLRNHDELTLEMVTDEERDYMYREYARDSRMRLNRGIRRRLAPLIDNSFRRIELLNSLLFSLPGTPIIYYGDEIGMGDNIYLGDRDGVRTPMQWSADRNAGFSKTDPARLYLPVIMDPVYGYGAVNVEAQLRTPSSLLNFMKRMIALRRQHKAFGRGTLDFLYPTNRKVLVYLRRYTSETILVVANLSRFVQPVELDLSVFRGWTPVEMIGRTEFPTIGDLPYFLTLGPHSFYWFRLEPQAEPIRLPPRAENSKPTLPKVHLDEGWEGALGSGYRYILENDVFAPYLPRQRWFRGKAREIAGVRLHDWCKMGGGFFLVLVEVQYADEGLEVYSLPLRVTLGEQAKRMAEQIPESILAWIKTPKGEGIVYDALADKTCCCDLFAAMVDGRKYPTAQGGRVSHFATKALAETREPDFACSNVRRISAEQSNTSVILDDTFILKFYRRIEPGPSPDMEIGLFLTLRTGFTNIAPVAGAMEYSPAGGVSSTVAMLQSFVSNEGDGWQYTLEALRHYFQSCLDWGRAGRTPPPSPGSLLQLAAREAPDTLEVAAGPYLEAVRVLGQRTAEFHKALATRTRDPNFSPEPLTPAHLEAQAEESARQAQGVMELLNGKLQDLPDAVREPAHRILMAGPSLISRFQSVAGLKTSALRIRCHGDYHLGQVLRTKDDFILLDFEGEPLRPLQVRREKQCPLRDVAGMIRSFGYAALSAALDLARDDEGLLRALDPWARTWERWVSSAFLRAYLENTAGAMFLPKREEHLDMLLRVFLLDKAFYELNYELNNRPRWIHIPLIGILDAADSGKEGMR